MFQPSDRLLFAFERLRELLELGRVLLPLLLVLLEYLVALSSFSLKALSLLREQLFKPLVFFLQFRCVHENSNQRNAKKFHTTSNLKQTFSKKILRQFEPWRSIVEIEIKDMLELRLTFQRVPLATLTRKVDATKQHHQVIAFDLDVSLVRLGNRNLKAARLKSLVPNS